jgi:succinate-semialdehyde dehydrogenase/glutarate-semialdehyde dehydrogenase
VCLISAKNEQDAIRQANDSRFGLGAGIFSRDLTKANHIAQHQLEAGACAINHCLSSDPALPFGGIKESGLGRELGEAGIKAFTNTKTLTQRPQKKIKY